VPAAAFDPFDPAQAGRHHEAMAALRAGGPVARLPSGLLAVTRYAEVRATLNDPALRNSHAARSPGVSVPPEDRLFFFEYDPPEHSALRRLLIDLLSRGQAERMAPAIRSLVVSLLGPIIEAGGGELVGELSVPLAGRLMMRVAGFPEEDAPQWRQWIKDMVLSGFSFTNRNARGAGFRQCYPEVLAYLNARLGAPRTSGPAGDGVLDRIRDAQVDGEPLSLTQQRMILFSVVSAGTNTLVNFLSNTLLTLAQDPALVARLQAERALIPLAVEESLRRDSPSMYLTRVGGEPTAVAGVAVPPNQRLLLGLASANRDGSVYPDADEFRLDRHDPPPHLAFGWGSHLCLGAWIARQTGITMLDAFLDVVGQIEIEPGTQPRPYLSPQGNGLEELPVRLTAAGSPASA
jgi:cytochrome P450